MNISSQNNIALKQRYNNLVQTLVKINLNKTYQGETMKQMLGISGR